MTVVALICGISFIAKNIIQYFLDTYAITEDGKEVDTFFRARYFLPYSYDVPPKFASAKRICNLFFYCFITTAVLYIILWNVRK
jgi:hypothetical protein